MIDDINSKDTVNSSFIDLVFESLQLGILKAARNAENQAQRFKTQTVRLKDQSRKNFLSKDYIFISNKIKRTHYEWKMTGCRDSSLKLLIKEYKADLRKLTKFELEQKNKNKSN